MSQDPQSESQAESQAPKSSPEPLSETIPERKLVLVEYSESVLESLKRLFPSILFIALFSVLTWNRYLFLCLLMFNVFISHRVCCTCSYWQKTCSRTRCCHWEHCFHRTGYVCFLFPLLCPPHPFTTNWLLLLFLIFFVSFFNLLKVLLMLFFLQWMMMMGSVTVYVLEREILFLLMERCGVVWDILREKEWSNMDGYSGRLRYLKKKTN